jgi:hypothetical protein
MSKNNSKHQYKKQIALFAALMVGGLSLLKTPELLFTDY